MSLAGQLVSSAWTSLQNGRFPWQLLATNHASAVLNQLRRAAATLNGLLPVSSLQELTQLPVSFQANGTHWVVFLHVPLVQDRFRLLRVQPSLFLRATGHSNTTLTLRPTSEYILANSDDSLHREETRASIDAHCTRFSNTLWCYNLGVFRRSMATSCLGALLSSLHQPMAQLCPTETVTADTDAIAVSPAVAVLWSRGGGTVELLCDNGTRSSTTYKGLALVSVEPGCAISTMDFYMRRSQEINTRSIIHVNLAWPEMTTTTSTTTTTTTERPKTTDSDLDAADVPLNSADDSWDSSAAMTHHLPWAFLGLAVVVIIVIILGCGILCHHAYRRRAVSAKKSSGSDDPLNLS
jgi:hypothetical protein